MSGRIGLRGNTASEVVSTRGLIGRPPTPIQFEQLPLHQRSAERVITVYGSVLDVTAGGEVSRRIAIPEPAFAVCAAIVEPRNVGHIRTANRRIRVID